MVGNLGFHRPAHKRKWAAQGSDLYKGSVRTAAGVLGGLPRGPLVGSLRRPAPPLGSRGLLGAAAVEALI